MNRGELRNQLRIRLDDVSGKRLWLDPELNLLINEAYNEACERSELLRSVERRNIAADADRAILLIDLPNAFRIDAVIADGRALEPTSDFDMDRSRTNWRSVTGRPVSFLPNRNSVLIHPTPTQAVVLDLHYVRIPEPLAADSDEPEIESRYHLRMLDWALHLAYDKRDADAESQQRSMLYAQKFEQSFGFRHTARQQMRRSDRRSNTVRPYGF